jgi:uncharacterized protein YwqG
MALIFDEEILDLEPFGLVTLARGASYSLPLPAHKFGYATYHAPDGIAQDRLLLFARALSADVLRAAVDHERTYLAGAVASVVGFLNYVHDEACDDYLEMPSYAFPISNGRALLLFASKVRPHLVRIVDVVRNLILREETLPDLRARLGVSAGALARFGHDSTVVHRNGGDCFLMSLGTTFSILRVVDDQLQRIVFPWLAFVFNVSFTKSQIVEHSDERTQLRFGALDGSAGAHAYISPLTKKAGFLVSTAFQSDRVALAHPNGIIEIIEDGVTCTHILRPFPRAHSKEGSLISLSPNGRYALMWDEAGSVVIDIDQMLVADVHVPDMYPNPNREWFDPTLHYPGKHAITNQGGYVLHEKQLRHTPYESLTWRRLAMHDPQARKRKSKPSASFEALLAAIHRPAVGLGASSKKRNSKLYGAPRISRLTDWPKHESEPMLPLCDIDLSEVAASIRIEGLPQTGGISVYVAIDGEDGPLCDEMFDPVAVRVVYSPTIPDVLSNTKKMPVYDAQWLTFTSDESVYPQLDSIAIEIAQLTDDETDAYRVFLDEKLPDGATSGHRLGGYPHLLQNNDLEARAFEKMHGHGPQSVDAQRDAARWQLLLQIDSDDEIMWGTDSGMLYLMIHEDDLRQQDFSRVLALTDGY